MTDLQKRMDALYQRKVVKPIEAKVRRAALDLLGTLKVATPVDTGRAQSNWHLDVGAPSVVLVEPGQDLPADTTGYSIEKTIFCSNNVPYIGRLNDGHSIKAPAGFVEASVVAVRSRIK